MRILTRKNVFILAITSLVLFGGAFYARYVISKRTDIVPPELGRVHYYNNLVVSLNNIDVKIFYVLPSGGRRAMADDWQKAIDESFKKISRFHSVQFLGKSAITHDIFPEPIFLEKAGEAYGAAETLDVNLDTLKALEREAFAALNLRSEAELKKFLKTPSNHYSVLFFVFEGKGMGGDRGRAYVPALILGNADFLNVKESIIYRAIGGALGFKDGESEADKSAATEGIMGLGLSRPLEINFIEPEILQRMGLL